MLALLNAGLTPGRPRARLARRQRRPRAARPLRAGADRRGRGVGRRRAASCRRPRRWPRAGLAPVTLRAKEGLALINGTDGILGMLVPGARRPATTCCRLADVTAAMTRRGAARHRPRLRRRPAGAAPAARPGRQRGQPRAGCWPARRSSPATATATPGCRTPTRCAARRRCTAPRATRSPTPRASPSASCDAAIDNPMILPDGRVESCGNFHGAPLGLRLRLPRHRRRRGRRDRRAAHRPAARPHPLARPAAVPRPRRRASTRGMMIAHYTQAAMVAENRRLAVPASVDSLPTSAMQEDHVSMGWGAARKLRRSVANLRRDPGRRAGVRGARRSTCGRRSRPAAGTGAALAALRARGRRARARTAGWRPSWRAAEDAAALDGAVLGRRSSRRSAPLGVTVTSRRGAMTVARGRCARRAGTELTLPGLAAGGRRADAA